MRKETPKWADVVKKSGAKLIDLVIRDATVIDGTRAPRFAADIAIRDGRIAAIGRVDEKANREINARGKIAAPGFIDAHTHDDRLMLSSPDMAPKVSQGVTTVVAGNCGISLAPAPKGMRAPVAVPLDLLDDEGGWFRYKTFKEYVDALRSQPAATNCALLVGHSMLRVQTMDSTSRPATREEIKNMRAMVEEAMEAGALGLSTGLYYEPANAAPTEEVIELCRPLAEQMAFIARTCVTRASTFSIRSRRPSGSGAKRTCPWSSRTIRSRASRTTVARPRRCR